MPHPSPRRLSRAAGQTLMAAFEADLARHGKRAIAALRRHHPDAYLCIALDLLPDDTPGPAPPPSNSRHRRLVTAERLRALLDYDPDTGRFHWRMRRGGAAAKGAEAGHRTAQGYRLIGIDGTNYLAHRLAWLHVHGAHPPDEIDHINGDPTDDRIANLRPCSRTENARNVRGGRSSRFKGVYRRLYNGGKTIRWVAHIRIDGKNRYLGTYPTDEEAFAAYKAAALEHYGEFARVDGPG
jgi:hypothetical protein